VNNPLTPSYFYPGGAENIDLQNDPFGHKTCSMSKANFKKASEQGVQAVKEEVEVVAGASSQKIGAFNKMATEVAISEKQASRKSVIRP